MSRGYGSYAVENRRRLERERQAAFDRVRQLQAEHDEVLIAAAADAGTGRAGTQSSPHATPAPSATASTAELNAWADGVQVTVDRLRAQVGNLRSAARASDLASHLRAIATSGELATPYEPARSPEAEATDGGDDEAPSIEYLTEQIERVVAVLDGGASAAEREQVVAVSQEVLAQTGVDPRTLLAQLKVLVQQIGEAAARRRRDRVRALSLVRSLDGVIGVEVDDVRALLQRVVAGETPLSGVDEVRVAQARSRAIAAEDQRYVAEHLAGAFLDLGYEVDVPKVSSGLASGNAGYAFISGSDDHAVELGLSAGRYSYRLVHTGAAADTSRDAELELALCKAVGEVTARGREAGVSFTLDEHHAAGSSAVQVVESSVVGRRRRLRDSEVLRERER